MIRESFIFRREWHEAIKELDDSVRFEIYEAIVAEAFDLEKKKLSPLAKMAMTFISQRLQCDKDKYMSICLRNSTNGAKGGRPRKTQINPNNPQNPVGILETQENPEKPKKADNDIQDTNVSMSISNNKKEEKEDTNVSKKKSVFIKPTIEEVSEHIISKGYHFDAENFHSFYESKGWVVGKAKMKDWKAACRTWESKWKESHPSFQQIDMFNAPTPNPQPTQQQQVYTAYGMTFGSQQEADAFSEVQVKIRNDYFSGKIKAASNQVDEHLRMGDAVKVIDGVIYDYD